MVRRDPFAMLPFCGYHMADYFNHWLNFGRQLPQPAAHLQRQLVPPRRGRQLPLAGLRREHARAAWIVERARGRAVSIESPIGWMPRYEDIDWRGLEDFIAASSSTRS